MSDHSKNSRSILSKLRSLVDDLSDRDVQLKRDFKLFESFLENFPIPVSMWSANLEGRVITKKDKGFFCNESEDLTGLFSCSSLGQRVLDAHRSAIKDGATSILAEKDEKTFFVTVAPRQDDDDMIVGVSGIAWDVSSNSFILNTLIDIKNVTETKSGSLEEINKKATKAIKKSRLFALINKEGA